MGRKGSGRRHWDTKDSTDDYMAIDIRRWKRAGLLVTGSSFSSYWSRNGEAVASVRVSTETNRVVLTYSHRRVGEDWQYESYPVHLEWTSCNLGGKRPWFLCPFHNCSRRVAILYGKGIFACRQCCELAYPSQREAGDDRAARRANRIRDKLGWKLGILHGKGWKPKGMHWSTYGRLTAEHDAFVQTTLEGLASRFGLLGK